MKFKSMIQAILFSAGIAIISCGQINKYNSHIQQTSAHVHQTKTGSIQYNCISEEEFDKRFENPEILHSIHVDHSISTISETKPSIEWKKYKKPKEMYVSVMSLNVRRKPSLKSNIIDTLWYNDSVTVIAKYKNWYKIKYNGKTGCVHKEYLSATAMNYKIGDVPGNNAFKSYMPYTAINSVASKQWEIQNTIAYTGTYGIRMVNNRYCVAIGSYYGNAIGQIFDIVMQNGTVIPCISADQKADRDTDSTNRQTAHDGSIVEFIVDSSSLVSRIKQAGNISAATPGWEGEISYFRIYDVVL